MEMVIGAILFLCGLAVGIKVTSTTQQQKEEMNKFDNKYRDKGSGLYKPIKLGGAKVEE